MLKIAKTWTNNQAIWSHCLFRKPCFGFGHDPDRKVSVWKKLDNRRGWCHTNSVTRRRNYFSNFWPLIIMKICPIERKNPKVDLQFGQVLNKPSKNYQRLWKFCQSGKILPSLVTLHTKNRPDKAWPWKTYFVRKANASLMISFIIWWCFFAHVFHVKVNTFLWIFIFWGGKSRVLQKINK